MKLYMEGNSGRAVGRIMGISKNTCIYWIKKYAKTIEEKPYLHHNRLYMILKIFI